MVTLAITTAVVSTFSLSPLFALEDPITQTFDNVHNSISQATDPKQNDLISIVKTDFYESHGQGMTVEIRMINNTNKALSGVDITYNLLEATNNSGNVAARSDTKYSDTFSYQGSIPPGQVTIIKKQINQELSSALNVQIVSIEAHQ
ncbi:MAG: hypothetical protein AAGF26_01995 [Cyanobacteria bacterium P01_G01_bin.49]